MLRPRRQAAPCSNFGPKRSHSWPAEILYTTNSYRELSDFEAVALIAVEELEHPEGKLLEGEVGRFERIAAEIRDNNENVVIVLVQLMDPGPQDGDLHPELVFGMGFWEATSRVGHSAESRGASQNLKGWESEST